MAQRMVVEKLHRLTLVKKAGAMAKHPDTREGVVEVVKAEDEEQLDGVSYDWYSEFDSFVATHEFGAEDDILEAFASSQKESAAKKQKKNYPDSEGPFAGPHNSFPIRSASDVIHAAERLHNAKGNQASIKARIIAIAHAHGYPLPKTWQRGGKKSSVEIDVNELLEVVKAAIASRFETPAEESQAEETPPEPEPEEKESAARPQHSHMHSHTTTYGYSYSHEHPHGDDAHAADEHHDGSETAHAHQHVAKAEDMADNPEFDALRADNEGLKKDLDAVRAELTALKESAEVSAVDALKAKLTETEEKLSAAEKRADRTPLTAAPVDKQSAQDTPKVTRDMSFDAAFDAALGRSTPLPPSGVSRKR